MALEEVIEELYKGSKCTKLATIILFMNLCTMHRINNKFVDELFTFFQLHLLLANNCLPQNYCVVKTLTRRLGLDYKNIHACGKGCVLFRGEYKNAISCPKCGAPRYKDEGNILYHVKIFKHFPTILRFQRMFRMFAMLSSML